MLIPGHPPHDEGRCAKDSEPIEIVDETGTHEMIPTVKDLEISPIRLRKGKSRNAESKEAHEGKRHYARQASRKLSLAANVTPASTTMTGKTTMRVRTKDTG